MIEKLPTLAQLLRVLQQIPYLSSKDLYRVADYLLQVDPKQIDLLCKTLLLAREQIKPCAICFCWYEVTDACLFCSSSKRNNNIICVVETWQEVVAIEKTKGYEGAYHVLGGVICPLEGIGPDDLTIAALIERVKLKEPAEIILATNQTPEGEATASYIAKKLNGAVKISCLAKGMPVGSSLKAMDRLTVYKALTDRRPF